MLADALMKKGMKHNIPQRFARPEVLADALMKKGMKLIFLPPFVEDSVLADALMKKGMKPQLLLDDRAHECWPMP